jgi:hypothetical protein
MTRAMFYSAGGATENSYPHAPFRNIAGTSDLKCTGPIKTRNAVQKRLNADPAKRPFQQQQTHVEISALPRLTHPRVIGRVQLTE